MHCPTCGAQNLPNAAFCSQCATNLLVPPGVAHIPLVTRTSGMAVAGFVLSFFCGLLGLIFSCIGYSECRKSNGTVTGEGLAIAGIVISILSFVIGVVIYSSGHHGRHY
jgi:uncharacterized protein DUF4190/zinc ribbon protein